MSDEVLSFHIQTVCLILTTLFSLLNYKRLKRCLLAGALLMLVANIVGNIIIMGGEPGACVGIFLLPLLGVIVALVTVVLTRLFLKLMKNKIPILRIIFGIIALLLFALSLFYFFQAKKAHDWVSRVKKAEPIHLNADLSKVGSHSITFHKIYKGMILLAVVIEKEITSNEEMWGYIYGIEGSYSLVDPNGNALIEDNFFAGDFSYDEMYSEPSMIFSVIDSTPDVQNLTFNLNIKEPAPAMADIEHKIVGRYILDLEPVVVYVYIVFGSTVLGISLIITISIIIITKKRRKKQTTDL
jgi:hypothetical protein